MTAQAEKCYRVEFLHKIIKDQFRVGSLLKGFGHGFILKTHLIPSKEGKNNYKILDATGYSKKDCGLLWCCGKEKEKAESERRKIVLPTV